MPLLSCRRFARRAYVLDADILRDPVAYDRLQELWKRSYGLSSESRSAARGSPLHRRRRQRRRAPTTRSPRARQSPAATNRRANQARAAWSPAACPHQRVPLGSVRGGSSDACRIRHLGASPRFRCDLRGLGSAADRGARSRSIDRRPSFGDPATPSLGFQFAGYTLVTAVNSSGRRRERVPRRFQNRGRYVNEESGFPTGRPTTDAGPLPPTASVQIHAGSPAEARERFGEGVAVQFVLDGDRVGVFVDSAPQDPVS